MQDVTPLLERNVAFANQIVHHNSEQPCAASSRDPAADLRLWREKKASLPKKLKVAGKAGSEGSKYFCKPFNPRSESSRSEDCLYLRVALWSIFILGTK